MSTTVETRLPEHRNPNISLKKVLDTIIKFFVNIFDAMVEARRLQAAYETAVQLRMHNEDFRQMSHSEIVQQVLNSYKK
jgi:hypothetical protein